MGRSSRARGLLLLWASCLALACPASAVEISVDAHAVSTGTVLSIPSEHVGVLADSADLAGASLAGCEIREQAALEAHAAYPGADDNEPLVAELKMEAARRGSNAVLLKQGGKYEDSGKIAAISASAYRIECDGGLLEADEILPSTGAWPSVPARRHRKVLESNPAYSEFKRLAAVAGCHWVRDQFSLKSPALDRCVDYSAAMTAVSLSSSAVAGLNSYFSTNFSTGTLADFFVSVSSGTGSTAQARIRMQLGVAKLARSLAADLMASPDWPPFVGQFRAAMGEDPPDPVKAFDRQISDFEAELGGKE
jgi:hypothetical protein